MNVIPANELENHIGEEIGVSDWIEITQERINQFADATNDHQFIHVDPEAAKAAPTPAAGPGIDAITGLGILIIFSKKGL